MLDLVRHILLSDDEDDPFFVSLPRSISERKDFFSLYDEKSFRCRFRLSKTSVLDIFSEIEHLLTYDTDRNDAIPPMCQLLVALRYYATGSFCMTLGDLAGVSKSAANRAIHKVSRALCTFKAKYIKFPTTDEEVRAAQQLNFEVASFPRVIGMLDCTHIQITSPGGNKAEQFRNRKGYMSLNVQVICNANLEIIDIVARWPGSSHDSTIFNSSFRKAMFEDQRYGNSLLLGDKGYPILPYLITPIENPLRREEILFNESQIRTRNCVERLFGVWKRRFPALALGVRFKLKNVFPVVIATAVLHNMLRRVEEDVPSDDPSLILPMPWDALLDRGQIPPQTRPAPSARRSNPGQRIRTILVDDYFKRLL